MTKKLYTVRVELEYAVMAESREDAMDRRWAREESRNVDIADCVTHASAVSPKHPLLPEGWEGNCEVYNSDGKTWDECVEELRAQPVVTPKQGDLG